MKTIRSHWTRLQMLPHGTAQQRQLPTQSTLTQGAHLAAHLSHSSTIGTATASPIGMTLMMTAMESSTCWTLIGIVILTTTQISTPSTVLCTGTMVRIQLTLTLTATGLKTTLIGTMTTTESLTFTTQMTETVERSTMIQATHLPAHTTQWMTAAPSMAPKTAHHTLTTRQTTGTSSSGTTRSLM